MDIVIVRILITISFSSMAQKGNSVKAFKAVSFALCYQSKHLVNFVSGIFFPVLAAQRSLWEVSDNEFQLTGMRSKEKVLACYIFCFRM